MKSRHILIVDDHPIVAEGMATMLATHDACNDITKVGTGAEAINAIATKHFDLAIVDFSLPDTDGPSLILQLRMRCHKLHIIIYTMHDEPWVVRAVMAANADAVVLKSDDMSEMITAINAVDNGQKYISKRFQQVVAKDGRTFTTREVEIMQLLSMGLSTRETAAKLCISESTVEYHRRKLMTRLGANNNAQLAALATAAGIIAPNKKPGK